MRTEPPMVRIRWVAQLHNAPQSMIDTADRLLRMLQEES